MAYNNGFPMAYQYQQMYPQFLQYGQQPLTQQQTPAMQQQTFSPPTIHAEILQVESEQVAENYPVAAGVSQMMIKKDDSEIYIKTAFVNGQSRLDVYAKRPERQNKQSVNLDGYVTKEELEERLSAILQEVKNNGDVRAVRKQTAAAESNANVAKQSD